MRPKQPLISIICPFFNEGAGVDSFYAAMCQMFATCEGVAFELICVNDGSADDTLARLIAITDHDARVLAIDLSRNFGKEAALTAGINAATGDAVIPIDADLQDPPELIPRMVEAWMQGAEVVLARRTDRSSDSFLKRKTAEAFYQFHNRVSDLKIPHNVGDFRLLDRKAVNALNQLPERQRFMKGLFSWVGFKSVTLDYRRNPRKQGDSKFSGWKLWNFALEGITSFSTAPLKIWMYVGLAGAFITLCYGAIIILRTLIYGVDLPGYASLLVSILFFGSLQLIGLGVLGEYIGRIYLETKQRPMYLIRQVHGQKRASISIKDDS